MKFRLFLALIAVSVLPCNSSAAPKKSVAKVARRTVLDYFRLLPARYFAPSDPRVLGRKAVLLLEYPQNDYLKFTHDEPHFADMPVSRILEIAVFRFKGRDLIALSAHYNPAHDTSMRGAKRGAKGDSIGDFKLLRLENGKWKNFTNALSPIANQPDLHFVLPLTGKTIRVFKSNGQPLAKLNWENGIFKKSSE